jgi:natural product precursor
MKRKTKKLNLSRETLRNLQRSELRRAVGGECTVERDTTCVCTEACNSGGTSGNTCGGYTCGWNCGVSEGYGCCQGDTHERLSGCASNC